MSGDEWAGEAASSCVVGVPSRSTLAHPPNAYQPSSAGTSFHPLCRTSSQLFESFHVAALSSFVVLDVVFLFLFVRISVSFEELVHQACSVFDTTFREVERR